MPHATVYMPSIHATGIAAQGDALCGMNDRAWAFGQAWMQLIDGDARGITCHPLCTQAAQEQADWLALNDFDERDPHRGEGGNYGNERLYRTGFPLPSWWSLEANYVESATRAWADPAQAAVDLANHDTHREHMHMVGWWAKWGFNVYGVGSAEAQLDRGGTFYVCVTGVEGD